MLNKQLLTVPMRLEELEPGLHISRKDRKHRLDIFVGDFNSKLESFGCAKKNASGPMLQNIQKQLNLIYLSTDEHTHLDRANGSTDILDMEFISPNLTKHDIQFQIGDDLSSDHLPIEISIDTPLIGTHLLTTSSTNLTRLTEKFRINTRGSARICGFFWTSVH